MPAFINNNPKPAPKKPMRNVSSHDHDGHHGDWPHDELTQSSPTGSEMGGIDLPIPKKPMRIHWLFNELREELISYQQRGSVELDPTFVAIQEIIMTVDAQHHSFRILEEGQEYNDAA